jgi:hypothetical protein
MRRLIPIFLLSLVLVAILPADAQSGTYYTLQASRVRSCASKNCLHLGTLKSNSRVDVTGTIDGQRLSGSTEWRQIVFEGKAGYIHSSLLTTLAPGRLATPGAVSPAQAVPVFQSVPTNPPPLGTIPPSQQTVTFACNGLDDLECHDFPDQASANAHLQQCGVDTDEDILDGDKNGYACEANPLP